MQDNLKRARARVATAAKLVAAGWLLVACIEDPDAAEPTGSPICVVNCGDAAALPAAPGGGGSVSAPTLGMPGSAGAGGTTGTAAGATGTTGGPGGLAGGTGGSGGAGDELPCDVKSIVQQRCGSCHGTTPMSAPMSLVTLAQWHAPAASDKTKLNHQLAKVRINASSNAMPPPSIGVLAPDEKQKLNAWLDQGAPAASGACATPPVPAGPKDPASIDVTGLECHKFLAHAPGSKTTKYKVGAALDAYVNFGFQAPWRGTFYLKVIKPVIDNSRALHHWLLYREQVQDGSVTSTIGQHSGGELLNGWAPGGDTTDLRTHGDIGMELPAGTYSIEIHYNSSDPEAQDASGVEVCGTSAAPKHIASLSWLGYDQGGTLSYATGICLDPATSWTGTCDPGHTQPIHLVSLTPHLHQAGRHLKAVINGPNGSRVLHDKPFDFAYQVTYDTHEVLMPGETITTSCTYSEPKCAGQSTQQEMCYLYALHYPKQTLVDYGPEGTFMHGEGVCLGQ
jgi:hypothetical protein